MERTDFERVWQRVQGGEDGEAALRREIGEAERLAAVYGALAKRWREGERYRREKEEELRALRREYYLLTGERCGADGGRARGGTLSLLRQALIGEERAAEDYTRRAGSGRTRRERMYGELGMKAERRAEGIQRAITATMK